MGDSDFASQAAAEGWSGSGTEEDPYVIEGYNIFGVQCIGIVDTSVYFKIRNCILDYDKAWEGGTSILLYNVTNAIVADNVCSGNGMGMYIVESSDNLIENNTCLGSSGSYTGIYLEDDVGTSDSNVVTNNTCIGYEEGIAIGPGCSGNLVEWNTFEGTTRDATDNNPTQVNNFTFNYYGGYVGTDDNGDGFGDSVYAIPPFLATEDSNPLMYPPTPPRWTEQPVDQTLELGFATFRYDLNVTCPSPVTWYVNHILFSVDNLGVVSSRAILSIGTYELRVVVTNIYGSTLLNSLRVSVLDTTPPGWLIIPTDQTVEYGESIDYQVVAIDLSGIENWEISDTVHFTLTASDYSVGSTARVTNAMTLQPGVHYLQITAYDPYDNFCTATIAVRVLEETGTTTTATTTTTTSTESDAVNPAMTFALGAGVGGGAVIVIVLAVLRRRKGD